MQDLKFIRPGLFHFNGPYVVSSVLINSIVILDDTDFLHSKTYAYYAHIITYRIDACRGSLVRKGGGLESHWWRHLGSSNLPLGVLYFLL